MAEIKNSLNQIVQTPEAPKVATPSPVTQAATANGLGAPSTPLGAASVGATTQQKAMMGTPAQTQNAARVNQAATTQTLDKSERLETAAGATTPQQEAKDKIDRLSTLGATKTAVESLIQKQIQQSQAPSTPNPQIAQASLAGIADPAVRTAATTALTAYTQNPTEENLKAVYDVVGRSGLDTGLSQYLDTAANTLASGAAQTAVTVGTLDLAATGVDPAQLAQTLGVTPEQLSGMSLEELNQKIDATQASSLQSTQQLQARLADPALSPQERAQVLSQLKQQGAAGITGAEAEVDALQSDIQSARMVNVAGGDYTVEELLGDDGISSLISGAVNDPKKLADLLRDPKTANLASWIQTHKTALATLSQSYDASASDFVGTQDTLGAIGTSLGQGDGGKSIIESILGASLPTSALSGQVAQYQQQLNNSGLYQYLKTDPKLTAELGQDKDTLQALVASNFTVDQIKSAVKLKDELQADPTAMKLLGVDGKIPTTAEDLANMQAALDRYDALDPRLVAKAGPYISSEDLSIDDLEDIASASDPNEVINDLDSWKQVQSGFAAAIKGVDPNVAAKKALFGTSDFTAKDLEYAMRAGSPEAKAQILSLFDANNDGKVSDEEMVGSAALEKVRSALGVGGTAADIIGKSGAYNGANVQSLLAGLGVDKGSFEKGVSTAINTKVLERSTALQREEETSFAAHQAALGAAEVARQGLLNSAKVSNANKAALDILTRPQASMDMPLPPDVAEKLVSQSSAKLMEYVRGMEQAGLTYGYEGQRLNAIKALAAAKQGPEQEIAKAEAAAQATQSKLAETKSASDKLRNLGYNIGSMDENQLYELATSMGIV